MIASGVLLVLARMSDWSNCINLVDDDMSVDSTDSITSAGYWVVGITFNVSSSSWVPSSGVLLVICLFVSFFNRQLTLCCFFGRLFFWNGWLECCYQNAEVRWVGVFVVFLWSITLVILVVVHFLMFWLIHIMILLFVLVGRNFFHLSVEGFGKGSDVIILCVRSMFVSYSTE